MTNDQVVAVDVRDAVGGSTSYSHEYPINPPGYVKIPALPRIQTTGMTPASLAARIHDAFINGRIFLSVAVNITVSSKTVPYERVIVAGDILYVRVLGSAGSPETVSGSYPVDEQGKFRHPWLGQITAAGKTLLALENEIEAAVATRGFLQKAVVHVSLTALT
jgi:protein involved in polysaccharide export with SLBB domain